jgi:hypothetical protein
MDEPPAQEKPSMLLVTRVTPSLRARVRAFRRQLQARALDAPISEAEAVRRLIELGLEAADRKMRRRP